MRLDDNAQIFSSNRIQSVTATGILYLDDNGKFEFIDFEECYQRAIDWQVSYFEKNNDIEGKLRFLEQAKREAQEDHWKEIGSRNAIDEPHFIEFYSEPHVRFEFRTYEEITNFRVRIFELGGWTTFDLA